MAWDGERLRHLRAAEAMFRVGTDRDGIPEVVEAAVELLGAGVDTPNVRVLAGEDRADRFELAEVLDAALRDLGETPLDRRAATLLIARDLVRQAIDDEAVAKQVAPILWRLFAADPSIDWPPTFVRLAAAADGVEDLPWWDGAIPQFLETARAFLAAEV